LFFFFLFICFFFFEKFIKAFKGETDIVSERSLAFNINDKLIFVNELNITVSPDELKIKWIQGIFKQNIKTKCCDKMGANIDRIQIWTKLKKIRVTDNAKEFRLNSKI
jgi:hypothetical protein